MVFVIVDSEGVKPTMLVRAESSDEVIERLNFASGVKIVGSFTSADIKALDTTRFIAIDS